MKELGGKGGIRTHGALADSTVFKTAAFNHSATFPTPATIHAYLPCKRVTYIT